MPFPDRVMGWIGAAPRRDPESLPGPCGLPGYARVGWARSFPVDLEPRLRLLLTQLAAVRSGCAYCVQFNRHLGLRGGVPAATLDAVADHARSSHFSELERAALALADALTGFTAAEGGFATEILVRARCYLPEQQIMALVALVATEHFFDPVTGALGRDARASSLQDNRPRS
jgi:alkylhydroperoxidase family enzyme